MLACIVFSFTYDSSDKQEFGFSARPKITEQIGLELVYPAFEDSLKLDRYFGLLLHLKALLSPTKE